MLAFIRRFHVPVIIAKFHKSIIKFEDLSLRKDGVDLKTNIAYGGDLLNPVPNQSFGSLLFERLSRTDRRNDVLQISISNNQEWTTANFLTKSIALAEGLREKGVQKGDFVLLFSSNTFIMTSALLSVFFLGAVPLPLSSKTKIDELQIIINNIKPTFLGCEPKGLYYFKRALLNLSLYDISKIFLLAEEGDPLEPKVVTFNDLIKNRDIKLESFQPVPVTDPKEDLALLMKTTMEDRIGEIVGLTHHNLNHVVARYDAKEQQDNLRDQIILTIEKMSWMSGFYSFLLSCCYGSKLLLMDHFSEEKFFKAVHDHKATTTYMHHSRCWQLFKFKEDEHFDLSSLKYINGIDISLFDDLPRDMREKKGLMVRPFFEMTEMTGQVFEFLEGPKERSAGKLVPEVYGKVKSEKTTQSLGPNEKGEICFKGATQSKGHINVVKGNKSLTDNEGYLLSGYYGYYDNDGYFFIIDKIVYAIMYKGVKVSPRELEGIIKSLESVRDVCVTGLMHPLDGFVPIAFVALQKGQKITENEIVDFVNEKVPDAKKLRGGVHFVTKIPRYRDSGKIKRQLFSKIMSKYRMKTTTNEIIPPPAQEPNQNNYPLP